MKNFILGLMLLLSSTLSAQLKGTIFAVYDGDSYRLRDSNNKVWVIRQFMVDAPDKQSIYVTKPQPFSKESGDHMRKLLKGKFVVVDTIGRDKFGRMLGEVKLDTIIVSKYMVSNGLGWYYQQKKIDPVVDAEYKALQKSASDKKLGLWGVKGVKMRPSNWRARYKGAPR